MVQCGIVFEQLNALNLLLFCLAVAKSDDQTAVPQAPLLNPPDLESPVAKASS